MSDSALISFSGNRINSLLGQGFTRIKWGIAWHMGGHRKYQHLAPFFRALPERVLKVGVMVPQPSLGPWLKTFTLSEGKESTCREGPVSWMHSVENSQMKASTLIDSNHFWAPVAQSAFSYVPLITYPFSPHWLGRKICRNHISNSMSLSLAHKRYHVEVGK